MDKAAYREMKFVENFIEFGALHRARVAWSLLQRFEDVPEEEGSVRGSIALDVLQTYLNAYEDVVLWLQVLRNWNPEETSVARLLERARFFPRHMEDLERLEMHSIIEGNTSESFAGTFRLPYRDIDNWERVNPASRERLRREIDELARLCNVFFWDAHYLAESGELALWRAWNKTKHGLFVTLTHSHTWGNVIMVHTDPEDLSNAYELPARYYDLAGLLVQTFIGCVFLGRTLNVLYQIGYQRIPDVSWLRMATGMDMLKISREKIGAVLAASRIPRQDLLLGSGERAQPRHFHPVFGWEFANDWWPSRSAQED